MPLLQRQQGNQEVTAWLRWKRLDEPAFLLRHIEINAAFHADAIHARRDEAEELADLNSVRST